MIPRLEYQKYPTQDGAYYAGNHNTTQNRLEIELVSVVGKDVYAEDDSDPYIFADFSFWSNSVNKD